MAMSFAAFRLLLAVVATGVCIAVEDEYYKYVYSDYFQPEQIHISFGEATNEIVVTWSTMDATNTPFVEYGIGNMDKTQEGNTTKFIDDGPNKHYQYIHRVRLSNLQYDTTYMYHCGSDKGISNMFTFKTPPAGNNWTLRAAIYGDMGNVNARSLTYLQEDTQRGLYDMILHVGDFAYDMDSDDAQVGDQFMRQLEPLAAYVPYMTCPGNHEQAYNFSNYKNRFSMPGPYENMFYSFDIGPVHFISVSTEFYYFTEYGVKQLVNQFNWLEEDLKKASDKNVRAERPWIILYGHRPMYCSDADNDNCTSYNTTSRMGDYGMEDILYKYGVDIAIWAHEHSYERTWPLYNYTVYNGSNEEPYRNPKAPVHIVSGSAGCQEDTDNFVKNPGPWSAFRSSDYGYTRFKAYNHTHIHMEQVSVDKNGQIIDDIWIIKDKHESYLHNAKG